jgi:hypothetical protein
MITEHTIDESDRDIYHIRTPTGASWPRPELPPLAAGIGAQSRPLVSDSKIRTPALGSVVEYSWRITSV